MRAWATTFALCCGLALGAGGCFSPEQPVCAFQCGPSGLCPDGYACRDDGYCHRNGTTDPCPFPDAAAPDAEAELDMSVPDSASPPDFSGPD